MSRKAGYIKPEHWQERTCPQCQTKFTVKLSDQRRHCSWACAQITKGQKRRRRVERQCLQCGKTFEVPSSRATRPQRGQVAQFCSRECSYQRWREHPEEHPSVRAKGGKFAEYLDHTGYIWVYVPGRGRMRQHRVVMEQMLGRELEAWETVHHKDGDRTNNKPENLELWRGAQPSGTRSKDAMAARIEELELRLAQLEARLKET